MYPTNVHTIMQIWQFIGIHLIDSITAVGENVLREVYTDIVGIEDLPFHWFFFIAKEGVKVYWDYLYVEADVWKTALHSKCLPMFGWSRYKASDLLYHWSVNHNLFESSC